MIEIPLTRGLFAKIDADDLPLVLRRKWFAHVAPDGRRYAMACDRKPSGQRTAIKMHRLIMSAPAGMVVDHINGDGTDNRRENLRVVSQQKNAWNSRGKRAGQPKGAYSYAPGRWKASIRVDGKFIHLGVFGTQQEAAAAYDAAAIKHFGEFARTNARGVK